MIYSNFYQNGINSNVLYNINKLITYARQQNLLDLPPGGLFPQPSDYRYTYKNKYDNMDDPTFWYTVHNGKIPNGYYAIQVGPYHYDVRLVSSSSQKAKFNNDYSSDNCEYLNRYKVILDQDGVHAKIVVNELNQYTKICSNCQKLFISDSNKYPANKNFFCSDKCEQEYHNHFPDDRILKTVCFVQKCV